MYFKLDPHTFGEQIIRLQHVFGENKYPEERGKILWDEIKHFKDLSWLRATVDHAVKTMKDINWTEEIAKKRERIASVERHASYIPIHNHDSIFSKQEISEHFKVLKGLFTGEISKEDGMKYKECVETAIGARKHNRCKLCDNDGLVFKSDDRNYQYVFRCNCDCGKRRQESFPMWGSFRERMFF